MYVFLFIGFTAFTQKTDRVAGGVNSAICFTVAAVAWYWARGTTQESDIRDEVAVVERRIMTSLRKMFDVVTEQVGCPCVCVRAHTCTRMCTRMSVNVCMHACMYYCACIGACARKSFWPFITFITCHSLHLLARQYT